MQNVGAVAERTGVYGVPPAEVLDLLVKAIQFSPLIPGSSFSALARKDRGGTRLRKELQAFGCNVEETARRHHRIVVCARPANVTGVDEALLNGGPQLAAGLDLCSQPGVFSWDRIDPGTALLMQHLNVDRHQILRFPLGLMAAITSILSLFV